MTPAFPRGHRLGYSFLPMPEEIMRSEAIGWGAKYLFGIIAKTNKEDVQWSLKDLANRMGCSPRAASDRVRELRENNLILVKEVPGRANVYCVNMELVMVMQGRETHEETFVGTHEALVRDPHEASVRGSIIGSSKEKVDKENAGDAGGPAKQFSFDEYLEKMHGDSRKHIRLIGFYWRAKGFNFESAAQAGSAIKRELRAATALGSYAPKRIADVIQWLVKNADFKWTLETVGKYIDEDLTKMSEAKRAMAGEFKCPFGFWHKKREICGHTHQDVVERKRKVDVAKT